MTLTVKAILARFGGDREKAIAYAYGIMDTYPRLRAEYSEVVDLLTGHEEKAKAAHV